MSKISACQSTFLWAIEETVVWEFGFLRAVLTGLDTTSLGLEVAV